MTSPDPESVPSAGWDRPEHARATPPIADVTACTLCGTPLEAGSDRCRECGFRVDAMPGRFSVDRRGVWLLVLLIAVVYGLTVAIVAAAR